MRLATKCRMPILLERASAERTTESRYYRHTYHTRILSYGGILLSRITRYWVDWCTFDNRQTRATKSSEKLHDPLGILFKGHRHVK